MNLPKVHCKNGFFSQVSIIRCRLKLEMKLKRKIILHIKTLFQIVAIVKMCGPGI